MQNSDIHLAKILIFILGIIFWPITLMYLVIKSGLDKSLFAGNSTEYRVSERLQTLDANQYTVLNNICLPSNGHTEMTQIDHIVVSRFGIFCIETKGQSGWIFGSKHQKYWTEVIYKNKYKLYNPIWQNYAHVKAIENLLGDALKAPIIPLLSFPNSKKIKIDSQDIVGKGTEVIDRITNYSVEIYDTDEYNSIVNQIVNANITDKDALIVHNEEIERLRLS